MNAIIRDCLKFVSRNWYQLVLAGMLLFSVALFAPQTAKAMSCTTNQDYCSLSGEECCSIGGGAGFCTTPGSCSSGSGYCGDGMCDAGETCVADCGGGPGNTPSISLTATPTTQIVNQGDNTNYALDVTSTFYDGSVNFTVTSGCPVGVTCTFSPYATSFTISDGQTNRNFLMITNTGSLAAGSYDMVVTASGSGVSDSKTVTLVVNATTPCQTLTGLTPNGNVAPALVNGNWTSTLSWNASAGATRYYLRVSDSSDNTYNTDPAKQFSGGGLTREPGCNLYVCGWVPNSQLSLVLNVVFGHSYAFWGHSFVNGSLCNASATSNFTVDGLIQGRVFMDANADGSPDGTYVAPNGTSNCPAGTTFTGLGNVSYTGTYSNTGSIACDGSGSVFFLWVPPGTYSLNVVVPTGNAGWQVTYAPQNFVIDSGTNNVQNQWLGVRPIPTPTGVTATCNGSTVTMTWNAISGPQYYYARFIDTNTNASYAPSVQTSRTYSIAAIAGHSYLYWVHGSQSDGMSYSPASAGQTVTCPIAPTVDVIANGSQGPVEVNYNSAASLDYQSQNATSCTISPSVSGFTGGTYANGLSTGNLTTTVTYTVTCYNGSLSGSDSVTVGPPVPPTNVTAACPAPGNTLTLSWARPAGYSASYVRLYDVNAGAYAYYQDNDPNQSYVQSNATPGHTYRYWVHTRGANGSYSVEVPAGPNNGQVTCAVQPTIALSNTSLSFVATSGGATPASQTVTLTNSGVANSTLSWGGSQVGGGVWCHVSPTSGLLAAGASQTLTLSVDAPSNEGVWSDCKIRISDGNATNNPVDIAFIYTVYYACQTPVSMTPTGTIAAASATLTWDKIAKASSYNIRLDDGINSPVYDDSRFAGRCSPHYYCENGISATTYCSGSTCSLPNVPLTAGRTYSYWIDISYPSPGTAAYCGSGQRTFSVVGAPTVDLKVNGLDNATINYNSSATLSWTSTNVAGIGSCTVSPGGLTGASNAGTSVNNLTTTQTYTISCSNGAGTATDSVTVTVNPPPVISLNPSSMSFSTALGKGTPTTQNVTITNTGGSPLDWTAQSDTNWCYVNGVASPGTLSAAATGGSQSAGASRSLTISVGAPSNVGTFNCAITFTAPNAATKMLTISYTVYYGDPTNVHINNTTCSNIDISWVAGSGNPAQYRVYRSTTASPALLATVSGTGYNDTNATAGAVYYYWVDSVGGDGTKVAADAYPVTVRACSPTNITVSNAGMCEQVVVSWNDVNGEAGYKVYRNTIASVTGATYLGSAGAGVTSYTDSGIPISGGAQNYYYFVSAYNNGGEDVPNMSASMPIGVPACWANLTTSDNDVQAWTSTSGLNATFSNNDCDGFNVLPANTVMKSGDTITLVINLCNTSTFQDASGITVTDYLTNFQMPFTGWNASYQNSAGVWQSVTPSVSGTVPSQTLAFNLGSTVPKQVGTLPTIRKLKFDVVAAPISGNASNSRFRNQATIAYKKKLTDVTQTGTVNVSIPYIIYFNAAVKVPSRGEASPQ